MQIARLFLILLFFTGLMLGACNSEPAKLTDDELQQYVKPLEEVNKQLSRKDHELIASYIERRKWKMDHTDRGVYYMVFHEGSGKKAEPGKIATIDYKISLLDGTPCYTSDSLGALSFRISRGTVISGLEEGILLLREGDKARLIIPPFLAWGLLGDDNKIPMRSIVVYELEVLQIADDYVIQ